MRLACALLAIFSAFPAYAAERMAGPVEAEVVRVVDGDTLVARARIWLG
ncbi:MAG TPA: nuclease, partial [Rhodobiaceae bacterium]|nr:nuclease [Rhodobiaceae bacterium]